MSFGDHLEELRDCLIKALLGLFIGAIFGFMIGDRVVDYLQSPLQEALSDYYQKQSLAEARAAADKVRKKEAEKQHTLNWAAKDLRHQTATEFGNRLAEKMTWNRDALSNLIYERRLIPETVWRDSRQIQNQVAELAAEGKISFVENGEEKKIVVEQVAGIEFPDERYLYKDVVYHPLASDPRIKTKSLGASEAFIIYLKASIVCGFIFSSPWIFWQLWLFVSAGLYPHEKRYIYIFFPFSMLLFILGVWGALEFVFRPVLQFLFLFNGMMNIDPDPRISEWMSFVLILPIGFGISFQLPLVMLFLERIGAFTVQTYTSSWRIALLSIFVISMFLTPADPTSMFMMALPLTVLYIVGILLCKYMPAVRRPDEVYEDDYDDFDHDDE